MLYDTETGETLLESASYPAAVNHPDGTQDAEAIFDLTVQTARRVCHDAKADIVALIGAWHSVMHCDTQRRPVTHLYS